MAVEGKIWRPAELLQSIANKFGPDISSGRLEIAQEIFDNFEKSTAVIIANNVNALELTLHNIIFFLLSKIVGRGPTPTSSQSSINIFAYHMHDDNDDDNVENMPFVLDFKIMDRVADTAKRDDLFLTLNEKVAAEWTAELRKYGASILCDRIEKGGVNGDSIAIQIKLDAFLDDSLYEQIEAKERRKEDEIIKAAASAFENSSSSRRPTGGESDLKTVGGISSRSSMLIRTSFAEQMGFSGGGRVATSGLGGAGDRGGGSAVPAPDTPQTQGKSLTRAFSSLLSLAGVGGNMNSNKGNDVLPLPNDYGAMSSMGSTSTKRQGRALGSFFGGSNRIRPTTPGHQELQHDLSGGGQNMGDIINEARNGQEDDYKEPQPPTMELSGSFSKERLGSIGGGAISGMLRMFSSSSNLKIANAPTSEYKGGDAMMTISSALQMASGMLSPSLGNPLSSPKGANVSGSGGALKVSPRTPGNPGNNTSTTPRYVRPQLEAVEESKGGGGFRTSPRGDKGKQESRRGIFQQSFNRKGKDDNHSSIWESEADWGDVSPAYQEQTGGGGFGGGMTFLEELESRQKLLARQSTLAGKDGERRHFLIVDDCQVSRKVAKRMLVNQGQLVSESVDGLDCLRIVSEAQAKGETPFDIILLDDDMPFMSGKECSKMLRKRGFKNPIIGLSGEIREYIINSFIEHGADAVLPKPLNLAQLEDKLKSTQGNEERRHFLVVDDCPVSRKVVIKMLTKKKQIVTEAKDGLECIKIFSEAMARKEAFDVILIDDDMPFMSGKEATTILRSRGFCNPIIGLSGEIREHVIQSFMDHGANAVLRKPLHIAQLETELRKFNMERSIRGSPTSILNSNAELATLKSSRDSKSRRESRSGSRSVSPRGSMVPGGGGELVSSNNRHAASFSPPAMLVSSSSSSNKALSPRSPTSKTASPASPVGPPTQSSLPGLTLLSPSTAASKLTRLALVTPRLFGGPAPPAAAADGSIIPPVSLAAGQPRQSSSSSMRIALSSIRRAISPVPPLDLSGIGSSSSGGAGDVVKKSSGAAALPSLTAVEVQKALLAVNDA